MDLEQIIARIDELKLELDGLKPLKPEYQQKLDRKLRLDWNYNSNHIEGNTLTYGETELLLFFDKMPEQSGSKDFREFEEMKEHDVATKLVEELAKDQERGLTEGFICDLNKIILVRNFWKDAITPDGQPTRKEIKVGNYKKTPNSVLTATGELFNYPSPQETPALMVDLIQWYKEQVTSNTHPLLIAALLHYKFVCIHPFDDGNGRISRLLMNYVLLKYDYPPAIIKSEDKKAYLTALNRADAGDTEAFISYIGEQLIRSLELSIKAAKGESIEEQGDLDKEIELLKRKLKSKEPIKIIRSKEVVDGIVKESIIPLMEEIYNKLNTFNELFFESSFDIIIYTHGQGTIETKIENHSFKDTLNEKIHSLFIMSMKATLYWNKFKYNAHKPYVPSTQININFNDFTFMINYNANSNPLSNIILTKKYDEVISSEEQNTIIESIKKSILAQIKSLSE